MRAFDRKTFRSGPRQIDVAVASITQLGEHVDAIVSSDDNRLSHGGGVSKAIWHGAGPELARFVARAQPPLRLGQVFVSPAGNLSARLVIHAVSLDLDENRAISPGQLAPLYFRVLETAAECDCRSVALPLIGTGAAGVDAASAIRALDEAIDAWLASPSKIRRLIVSVIGQSFQTVISAIEHRLALSSSIDEVLRRIEFNHGELHRRRIEHLMEIFQVGARESSDGRGIAVAFLHDSAVGLLSAVIRPETRAGHTRTDEASSASLSEVLRICTLGGIDVPGHIQATLTQGEYAKNRLLHAASQGWLPEDLMAMSLAARQVLSLVPAPANPNLIEVPESSSAYGAVAPPFALDAEIVDVGSDRSKVRAHPRDQPRFIEYRADVEMDESSSPSSLQLSTDARLQKTTGAVAPVRVAEGGTAHVRALQKFLQTYLDPGSLQELGARLQQRGYVGTPEARLLEHCLRLEDPVNFVASEFSRYQLATAVHNLTGKAASHTADASQLAEEILEFLGFPLPRQLGGLATAQAIIEQERNRLRTGIASDIGSAVTRVAQQLECICHVLLRFLSRVAYDKTPEELFRGWEKLTSSETLATAGLGKLIVLVEAMDAQLERDETAVPRFFKGAMQKRQLFPPGASDLANLRNSFVHYREREASEPYVKRLDAAARFLDAARHFVEYLRAADTRLFPLMVRVTRIEIDAWGRRRIHAIDDEGREELIFTDMPLEPGRVYFMQPLSNPVRVDPILVPAGDMVWPETSEAR